MRGSGYRFLAGRGGRVRMIRTGRSNGTGQTSCKWVDAGRDIAEAKGYTVVDPPSVIATHLTQIIKDRAYELLGRQEVQSMIDYIKEQNPAVVQELIPDLASVGDIQRILSNLLQEQVPIRDMVTILETLADYSKLTRDHDVLTEYVRQALRRHITKLYAGADNRMTVVTLDPGFEEYLRESLQQSDFGSYQLLILLCNADKPLTVM